MSKDVFTLTLFIYATCSNSTCSQTTIMHVPWHHFTAIHVPNAHAQRMLQNHNLKSEPQKLLHNYQSKQEWFKFNINVITWWNKNQWIRLNWKHKMTRQIQCNHTFLAKLWSARQTRQETERQGSRSEGEFPFSALCSSKQTKTDDEFGGEFSSPALTASGHDNDNCCKHLTVTRKQSHFFFIAFSVQYNKRERSSLPDTREKDLHCLTQPDRQFMSGVTGLTGFHQKCSFQYWLFFLDLLLKLLK